MFDDYENALGLLEEEFDNMLCECPYESYNIK
jgi:hypothetical protein